MPPFDVLPVVVDARDGARAVVHGILLFRPVPIVEHDRPVAEGQIPCVLLLFDVQERVCVAFAAVCFSVDFSESDAEVCEHRVVQVRVLLSD